MGSENKQIHVHYTQRYRVLLENEMLKISIGGPLNVQHFPCAVSDKVNHWMEESRVIINF